MKAVLALLLTYCAGTPLSRRVSTVSALVLALVLVSRAVYPDFGWMFQTGYMPDASPALRFFVVGAPVLAVIGLFFGTFLLPVVLGQLATARRLRALPQGRFKVIVSALLCVVLIALAYTVMFALYVPAVFRDDLLTFSGALAGYTLLYVVLWLITRSRTVFGKLASSMLLIAVLAIPAWLAPRTQAPERLIATILVWTVIAIFIGRFTQSRGAIETLKSWLSLAVRFTGAGAADGIDRANEDERVYAVVGTARPWLAALGPVLPFLIAAFFVRTPEGWLFYLTLFATLTGAIASLAARRSRALWLRSRWTRDEIFVRLERAFWRQNNYGLCVLALTHAAICIHFALPLRTGLLGIPLLGLATATSTYLGFMMTRRIHWAEIPLTLATMALVMITAVSISDAAVALEWTLIQMLVLVAATLAFRAIARRRWRGIDWASTNASSTQEA